MVRTRKLSVTELTALQIGGSRRSRIQKHAVIKELGSEGFVKRMASCVKGTGELSQAEIRKELNSMDAVAWEEMIDKFLGTSDFKEIEIGSFADDT